jgi:hypothetical protein
MIPNISDYTFEKLIKYNSSNVIELLSKLQIEIKSLELEIQYRLNFRVKANSFTRPILPRGTKITFSHPKTIYEKYINSYDVTTRSKQSQLVSLKDEKQRVLLNQSLRGIEHDNNVKFTPFVFTSNVIWNPSWYNSKLLLESETGKLLSQLSQWRNNQILQEKIIEKVEIPIVIPKIIPKIIIPTVVPKIIPKIIPTIVPKTIPTIVPEITPKITPEIVATSSILIPLGIIGLLLYSRTGRK